MRKSVVIGVMGLSLMQACASSKIPAREVATDPSDPVDHSAVVSISEGPFDGTLPVIEADSLVLPGGERLALAASTRGSLTGWLSPRGVTSPDGSFIIYNAWNSLVDIDPGRSYSDQGIRADTPIAVPSLRLVDLGSGNDVLLQEGAYSAALDAAGHFAYVRGQKPEVLAGIPYLGDVMVADSPTSAAVVWSGEPDRYVVAGWAGSHLLVYTVHEGEELDLVVFDGPGRSRILAKDANLVAISPDGRDVLVSQSNLTPPVIRVLDVATGDERGAADLYSPGTWDGDFLHVVGYGGSWVGSRVVADSDLGIVVIDVVDGRPAMLDVLRIPKDVSKIAPHEPRLIDEGASFEAWTPVEAKDERQYRRLVCVIATRTCEMSEVLHTGDVFGFAYNPSGGSA